VLVLLSATFLEKVAGVNNCGRGCILVFSGPPCSGKSKLAELCAATINAKRFAMDEIRQAIRPDARHTISDRDAAYQSMHDSAKSALSSNQTIILDATYARKRQRAALAKLLRDCPADAFIVECSVDPDEAVARFAKRPEGHAAIDLTEESVREKARSFQFTNIGLYLDTTGIKAARLAERVLKYLAEQPPVHDLEQWARTGD